ncbi:MAG: DUF4357 domain-containing protein [Succinivibrio sp.]
MDSKSVSFLTGHTGKVTHAVIPIELYRQLLSVRSLLGSVGRSSADEIYTLNVRNVTARGYPTGSKVKPGFLVLKGSQVVLIEKDSVPEHIKNIRESYLGDGTFELDAEHNCFVLTKDLQFKSPSAAAAIIAGTVRAGPDVWLNSEGFSLKESGFYRKSRTKRINSN